MFRVPSPGALARPRAGAPDLGTRTPSAPPGTSGRRLAAVRIRLALALPLALGACGLDPDPTIELKGPTMGTYYAIKIPHPPAGLDAQDLQRGVQGALDAVIAEISTYDPQSELSRLNRNPVTDWLPISPNLLAVLEEGLAVGALADGAFDITVGPLVNLWGFGPEHVADAIPAPEAVRAAQARVGAHLLELRKDPPALRKRRTDVYIDLSALGEGEGADRVAAFLESKGLTDYMVAVAGTLRVRGKNPRGEPWGIAIEEPRPDRRSVQRILPVTDRAISTSGDYRNFFAEGGRRYSHHIDPRTGEPVAQRLASVSVVLPAAPGAARRADGLATALLLLGEDKGPQLATEKGIAAYFIVREDQGFREIESPALKSLASP
jgi:thiamine biosynthesis lipoprotein